MGPEASRVGGSTLPTCCPGLGAGKDGQKWDPALPVQPQQNKQTWHLLFMSHCSTTFIYGRQRLTGQESSLKASQPPAGLPGCRPAELATMKTALTVSVIDSAIYFRYKVTAFTCSEFAGIRSWRNAAVTGMNRFTLQLVRLRLRGLSLEQTPDWVGPWVGQAMCS